MSCNVVEARIIEALINNAPKIAKSLTKGSDIEIRKTANGVSIYEVRKKPVAK